MANLPIPSWIPGAPDTASQFLGGLRAGAAIQQEQARLAQEANLTEMRLMVQQQESERQNALERERLAQTRAYQQQEVALRQQELQQQKAVNDIKIQESARLFQAQQNFQQWLSQNPDADPAEGILKFFPGTDAGSMAGYGTLARSMYQSKHPLAPPSVENVQVGDHTVPFLKIPEMGGGYRMQRVTEQPDVEGRMVRMHELSEMERRRDKLEASMTDLDRQVLNEDPTKLTKAQKARYDIAKKKQERIDTLTDAIDKKYQGVATGDEDLGDTTPRNPPGAGVQFRFNPKTRKIEPVSGGGAPAPAGDDWTGGASVMRPTGAPWSYNPAMMPSWNQPNAPLRPPQSAIATPSPVLPSVQPPPPRINNPPLVGPLAPLLPDVPQAWRGLPDAQRGLSDRLGRLSTSDLVEAAKRLGVPNPTFNEDTQSFYAPQMPGGPWDRDDFENRLIKLSSEQNVDPLP